MGITKQVNDSFSKDDTQVAKGIAILCMMFHHTIPNVCHLPIFLSSNVSILSILAATGKICVSLLTILSGYGLAQVYRRQIVSSPKQRNWSSDFRFVGSHLVQLISVYLPINAMAAVAFFLKNTVLVGNGVQAGITNLLLGIFGINRYVGDWYLLAIIILYLLFPVVYRLVQKFGIKFLAVSWLPWVLYFLKLVFEINIKLDSVVFYIFAFSLGVYLSVDNKLVKKKEEGGERKYGLLCMLAFVLRIVFSLPVDTFLSLSILMLLTRTNVIVTKIQKPLKLYGIESANIWLIHPFILALLKYFSKDIWWSYILVFIFLSGLSLVVAITISFIEKKSSYRSAISIIRKRIEA